MEYYIVDRLGNYFKKIGENGFPEFTKNIEEVQGFMDYSTAEEFRKETIGLGVSFRVVSL